MLNLDIKVELTDSYYRKLNSMTLVEACSDTIQELTTRLEEECRKECPVQTGNLRDGHFSSTTILQGNIHNHVEYAPYVIYGTSRQAPNNYPQRARNKVILSNTIQSVLEEHMRDKGLL